MDEDANLNELSLKLRWSFENDMRVVSSVVPWKALQVYTRLSPTLPAQAGNTAWALKLKGCQRYIVTMFGPAILKRGTNSNSETLTRTDEMDTDPRKFWSWRLNKYVPIDNILLGIVTKPEVEANLEFNNNWMAETFAGLMASPVPDTVHSTFFQDLPQLPAEAVGSITMLSQAPIVVEVDSDTSGITGLAGAVTATVEELAYKHCSPYGQIGLMIRDLSVMLLPTTKLLALVLKLKLMFAMICWLENHTH